MFGLMDIWTKELLKISPSIVGEWPDIDVPGLSFSEPMLVLGCTKKGLVFVTPEREQVERLLSDRMVPGEAGDVSPGFIALHPKVNASDLRLVRMFGEQVLSRPYRGRDSIPID
jgi:hypothetical protein